MKVINIKHVSSNIQKEIMQYMESRSMASERTSSQNFLYVIDSAADDLIEKFQKLNLTANIAITTLDALADFINQEESWNLYVNDVIEYNGWKEEPSDDYIVCMNHEDVLLLDQNNAHAYVRSRRGNYSYILGKITAIVEEIALSQNLPLGFSALVAANPKDYLIENIKEWINTENPHAEDLRSCYTELLTCEESSMKSSVDKDDFMRGYSVTKNYLEPGSKYVGRLLSEIRVIELLKIVELSNLVGLSQSTISRMETGSYNYGVNAVKQICDALGYEIILRKREN